MRHIALIYVVFHLNFILAQDDMFVIHESDTSRTEYRILSVYDSLTELNHYRFDILYEKVRMKGALKSGKYESFYENGGVSSRGNYNSNGLKEGVWKHFYVSGELSCVFDYDNGKLNQEVLCYHENGSIKSKGRYVSIEYTEVFDGQVLPQFKEIKVGYWKYFHDNGKIECEGDYLNYTTNSSDNLENREGVGRVQIIGKNLKDGKWIHYDEMGNYVKTEFFNWGELSEVTRDEYVRD